MLKEHARCNEYISLKKLAVYKFYIINEQKTVANDC